MSEEKVKITIKGLIENVQNGMNRKDLAAHYGLPVTQINKAFKEAEAKGLIPKNMRAGVKSFVLIDDTEGKEVTDVAEELPQTDATTQA